MSLAVLPQKHIKDLKTSYHHKPKRGGSVRIVFLINEELHIKYIIIVYFINGKTLSVDQRDTRVTRGNR